MDWLDLMFARNIAAAQRLDACMAGVAAVLAVSSFCLIFAPSIATAWQGLQP